jgi:hypothetical protein
MIRRLRARPAVICLSIFVVAALSGMRAASAAEEPRAGYSASLTEVYGAYQSILARREACGAAFPQNRSATDKAYVAWQGRHKKLLSELDQRVNMMIRNASRDEKDYTKNIGKYEGAILRQREEVKQTLLQQPRAELELECKAMPEFLQGADSDLEKEFAEQLVVLRKRPLARK